MHGPPPTVDDELIEWYAVRYVLSNMRTIIKVGRIKGLELSKNNDHAHVAKAVLVYEGPARIYSASGPQNIDSSEESTVFATSNISTPMRDAKGLVLTQANDIIQIVKTPDELLKDRYFRILDVEAGGHWPHVRKHVVIGAERYEGWTWIDG